MGGTPPFPAAARDRAEQTFSNDPIVVHRPTFAVQIATSPGADITGVCHTTKVDLVRSLGADQVIDYT